MSRCILITLYKKKSHYFIGTWDAILPSKWCQNTRSCCYAQFTFQPPQCHIVTITLFVTITNPYANCLDFYKLPMFLLHSALISPLKQSEIYNKKNIHSATHRQLFFHDELELSLRRWNSAQGMGGFLISGRLPEQVKSRCSPRTWR